ncbi:MAG: glycerophosphoryl diester phosphodiesterase membrane domain-containing protein [Lachnospiraceae bacterium]|nr:glycerophosphoryl diester phosphodiesterase membrane domain-containing protein [Lachnospiraceae bacterium]
MKTHTEHQKLIAYFQNIPWMLNYQIVSTLILFVIFEFVHWIAMVLIYSTGRVAVTNSDLKLVVTTWQGWAFFAIFLISVFFSVAFNINGMVILADKAIKSEPISILKVLKDAIFSIKKFLNKDGILFCIYVAIGTPLIGVGIKIKQTENFRIPDFITSVIYSRVEYTVLYFIGLFLLAWYGIRHIFLIPGVVLDNKSIKDAIRDGKVMIRKNKWHFLFRFTVLIIQTSIVIFIAYLGFEYLPVIARPIVGLSKMASRFTMLFIYYICFFYVGIISLMLMPINITELTRLYCCYRDKKHILLAVKKHRRSNPELIIIFSIFIIAATIAAVAAQHFDLFYPASKDVKIIAHRLGGYEAAENSLTGLDKSIKDGAYGYETDVQRSKDGVYVINHDYSFFRTCGDSRAVSDITWKEIKKLRMTNPDGTKEAPPSLEQVLDKAKGNGILYIELKGDTADEKMCDDVVSMIEKKGMEKQCVILSLKYNLIQYIYRKYNKIEVGFLYFFSYGDVATLDSNLLVMEEDSASADAINTIHAVLKKAIVWTIDTDSSAEEFLNSNADAVITDNVKMCKRVQKKLSERSDYERVFDSLEILE